MNELLALNQIELEKRKSSQQPNIYFQTGNAYLQLEYYLEAEAWFIRGLLFGDRDCANKLGYLCENGEVYDRSLDLLFAATFYKLAGNEDSKKKCSASLVSKNYQDIIHDTMLSAIYNKDLDKIFKTFGDRYEDNSYKWYCHDIAIDNSYGWTDTVDNRNYYFDVSEKKWWYLQSAQLDNLEAWDYVSRIFKDIALEETLSLNYVKNKLSLFILKIAEHYNKQGGRHNEGPWWYERASLMGCPEASLWLAEQHRTGEVKVKKYNYELKFFNDSLALAQNYKNKNQLEKFTYYIDLILKSCSKDISAKPFHDAITLWCGVEVLEGYELFEQLVKYRFGLPGIAPTFVKQEQNTKFEEKIFERKLIVEKETTIRDIIKLDNIALHKAIALIENQSLQDKLYKLLERSVKKLPILNNDVLSTVVFSKERDAHIRMLQAEVKEIVESDEYIEFDKTLAVEQILPDLIYPFWSCRPSLKIETEIEREQNIAKEQHLFNEQKAIRIQPTFIQTLSKFKEERKNKQSSKPKIYFLYAWPIECNVQRESWIHEFLTNLRRDLKRAGIEAIFDREDNFSGNNLMQFMGQILQDNCIVLVFGTESFRHKWFSHKMALQIEGELLKLKWLTDFSEGKIKHNQGTTIIPFVISGIRETAIPEDLLPAKNPIVRAFYNLSYKTILYSILAVAYGITEKTVKKIISGINDLTEELNQPIRSESTNYSNIQQQTLFGAENNQTRNNNTIATSSPLENFVKSNTNIPN